MFGFSVPGGVAVLVGKTDARVRVHKLEADGLKEITGTGESDLVRDESGYRVALAELVAELIHTPGHTPGRQRFPLLDRLVSGDMFFVNGCRRVDLPGSDPDQMYETVTGTLAKLADVVLYPGRDYGLTPTSTMREQRSSDHSLRIRSLDGPRARERGDRGAPPRGARYR